MSLNKMQQKLRSSNGIPDGFMRELLQITDGKEEPDMEVFNKLIDAIKDSCDNCSYLRRCVGCVRANGCDDDEE